MMNIFEDHPYLSTMIGLSATAVLLIVAAFRSRAEERHGGPTGNTLLIIMALLTMAATLIGLIYLMLDVLSSAMPSLR